jgi:hypothetical protein
MPSVFRVVRKIAVVFIASLVLTSSSFQTSRAAEGGNGVQVGLIAGAGLVNGLITFAYGLSVGYRYGNNFTFGLDYTAQNLGVPSGFLSGYAASCGVSSFLGEAQYRFTDFLVGTYVIVQAGLIISSATLMGPNLSLTPTTTNLGFGGGVGYQFRPSDKFAVGPELSVQMAPGASITLINLLGRLSYKF